MLGTSFRVKAYPNSQVASVPEGKVSVQASQQVDLAADWGSLPTGPVDASTKLSSVMRLEVLADWQARQLLSSQPLAFSC